MKSWLPPTRGSRLILAGVVAFFLLVGGVVVWERMDAASVQSGQVIEKSYTPEKVTYERESDGKRKRKVEKPSWRLFIADAKDHAHVVWIDVSEEEYDRYEVGDDWKRG